MIAGASQRIYLLLRVIAAAAAESSSFRDEGLVVGLGHRRHQAQSYGTPANADAGTHREIDSGPSHRRTLTPKLSRVRAEGVHLAGASC